MRVCWLVVRLVCSLVGWLVESAGLLVGLWLFCCCLDSLLSLVEIYREGVVN